MIVVVMVVMVVMVVIAAMAITFIVVVILIVVVVLRFAVVVIAGYALIVILIIVAWRYDLGQSAFADERDAVRAVGHRDHAILRSEEHTSALQSLMRISYAVFC